MLECAFLWYYHITRSDRDLIGRHLQQTPWRSWFDSSSVANCSDQLGIAVIKEGQGSFHRFIQLCCWSTASLDKQAPVMWSAFPCPIRDHVEWRGSPVKGYLWLARITWDYVVHSIIRYNKIAADGEQFSRQGPNVDQVCLIISFDSLATYKSPPCAAVNLAVSRDISLATLSNRAKSVIGFCERISREKSWRDMWAMRNTYVNQPHHSAKEVLGKFVNASAHVQSARNTFTC